MYILQVIYRPKHVKNFCPRRTTKVLRKAFMVVSYPVGGGQVRGPRANFGHGYPPISGFGQKSINDEIVHG